MGNPWVFNLVNVDRAISVQLQSVEQFNEYTCWLVSGYFQLSVVKM